MDEVSKNHHLQDRGGVWYYRRRVPSDCVTAVGRSMIFKSLGTRDLKEARRRRDIEDVICNELVGASAGSPPSGNDTQTPSGPSTSAAATPQLDRAHAIRRVQDYVARKDARLEKRHEEHRPVDEEDRQERVNEAAYELQMLKDLDDPRAGAWIARAEREIGWWGSAPLDDDMATPPAVLDLLSRALTELTKRKLARLTGDRERAFFDELFGPHERATTSFGDLATQFLREEEEEAASNGVSQKSRDRTQAQIALVRELVGDDVPVAAIDYDRCMEVRRTLTKVPTNWKKHYNGLALGDAIRRGEAEGRPCLGAITQDQNLAIFRRILDLAVRKGLLGSNPATGIRPLQRDSVALADKRRAFTLDQLSQFFRSRLYQAASENRPHAFDHPKYGGWRFWLAPLMLFAGLRPNEACQALASDVRRTERGTWYIEVTDEAGGEEAPRRTLKNQSSRRRVPIHPQLIRMGFLEFVETRTAVGTDARLFDTPLDKYENAASYPLRWFREHYLPKAVAMEERQAFYSFRHSFRDALRRASANADVLEALGWSQGARVVSDHYGTKLDPDQLLGAISEVAYPGLDLSHLETRSLDVRDPESEQGAQRDL